MYANAQYIIVSGVIDSIRVEINNATTFVPIDPSNGNYVAIMALEAEGKLTITEAE